MSTPRPTRRLIADQRDVRRHNLSVVLGHLREVGGAGTQAPSRAEIATGTGLNKATVSSLVAELIELGLVHEDGLPSGSIGRPAQPVALSGGGICAVGVEVNVDYVAAAAVDLTGAITYERRQPMDTAHTPVPDVLDAAADLVREVTATSGQHRLTGVTLALPGLVEAATGQLVTAPNLGWSDLPIAAMFERALGPLAASIQVDNEANLAAAAEARRLGPEVRDLILLTGAIGVGAGIVVDGKILRGRSGFAAEVGHMPIELSGAQCGCGRRGCWETRVGLTALLSGLADVDDRVLDPTLDVDTRLAEIVARATAHEPRTLAALEQVGTWLGIGAATLANLFDPGVIVLGGYFAHVAPWVLEPVRRELARRAIGTTTRPYDVRPSELAFTGAVRGAAEATLEAIFTDPAGVRSLAAAPELVGA